MHEVLAVRSRRVVTPDGIRPASIQVRDGRIERVGGYAEAPPGAIDYGDLVLMAGIVDSHVHDRTRRLDFRAQL